MTMSEYEVMFHEISRHAMMILPIKQEMVQCFTRGLRFQLRMDTEPMVAVGHSFLEVFDYAHTLEHIHFEAQGGSDKRARH